MNVTDYTDNVSATHPAAHARPRPRHRVLAPGTRCDRGRRRAPFAPVGGDRRSRCVTSCRRTGSSSTLSVISRSALELDLARERLRRTQIGMTGGGLANTELLAVEEAIATREEDVLAAEVALVEQSMVLRRPVGMEIGPKNLARSTS